MNFIGKEPVKDPCKAETFEEAWLKNKLRLSNERALGQELYDSAKKNAEPAELYDPEFWVGAITANQQAYDIYREELEALRKRVAERIGKLELPVVSQVARPPYKTGWLEIRKNWVAALEKNDPSTIVYW